MNTQIVWIDATRCTGCGACVEACPVGAIAMVENKARVIETLCAGCKACLSVCRVGAIQPVVRGELIPTPAQPLPSAYRQPNPLAETVGAAAVVTGVGLLARAGGALVQAIGRWLTQWSTTANPPAARGSSAGKQSPTGRKLPVSAKGGSGRRGRQARHRRRGR